MNTQEIILMETVSLEKMNFYLNLAELISRESKCLKGNFGVVIVKNDIILGTGYNGPARGIAHCNPCRREGLPMGVGYDKCIAVHAEVNAIIQSGGRERCLGSVLYIASHNRKWDPNVNYNHTMKNFPCNNCARTIVNAGVAFLVQREDDNKPVVYDINELVRTGKII
jgi:dCMP deaminase